MSKAAGDEQARAESSSGVKFPPKRAGSSRSCHIYFRCNCLKTGSGRMASELHFSPA